MATANLTPSTLLSHSGLSVRAVNICASLDCKTVGDLVNLVQRQGAEFVMQRRNSGKKTIAELSNLLKMFSALEWQPQIDLTATEDFKQFEDLPNRTLTGFNSDELLNAAETLQISFALPIEFIRLPARVLNWCNQREWRTLGEFLNGAGAMNLQDLLSVDNIGKKSATEVLSFFGALSAQSSADLRNYLPLALTSNLIAFSEALKNAVSSLDHQDLSMLEMRLLEGATLEAIARNFDCTRELVRQREERFLAHIERVLNWFSEERLELWKGWENSDDLSPIISQQGISLYTSFIAAAISTIFENTNEGTVLRDYWRETLLQWSRELMSCESFFSDGIDLADFARHRGRYDLAGRFLSWLKKLFGNELSVTNTRVIRRVRELNAEQRACLYHGEVNEFRWRNMYEKLKNYYAEKGDADVPNGWKEDRQLAAWVSSQRERRKKGAMLDEEFVLLNALGLTWKSRDKGTWEDRFAEVVAFKSCHGHCDIPTVYAANQKLGGFVNSMRTKKKRGLLSAERIAKLDAIGFSWASSKKGDVQCGGEVVTKAWKLRFEELIEYKHVHGDCCVPAKWKNNEPLANWVSMQRYLKQKGALSEARIRLLEEIAFVWIAQ